MTATIEFRCRGRTDRSETHVIRVHAGKVLCSCQGVDWCSHIDATLVAGERAMVPPEDRRSADRAMRLMQGRIHAPEGWLASWREDRVWRGQAPARGDEGARMRIDGRPTILFLGSGGGGNRDEYVEHAGSLGWRVVERPTPLTTIVVSSAEAMGSRRGDLAQLLSLPIVTHGDWDEWCYDMTNAVLDRIEELSGGRHET